MERLSDSINDLVGRVCPALPLWIAVKEGWRDIVGEEIAQFASLFEVKFGMRNEINVIIEVLNSLSVIFKFNENEIKGKISIATGYPINKINLIIKQIASVDAEYKNAA